MAPVSHSSGVRIGPSFRIRIRHPHPAWGAACPSATATRRPRPLARILGGCGARAGAPPRYGYEDSARLRLRVRLLPTSCLGLPGPPATPPHAGACLVVEAASSGLRLVDAWSCLVVEDESSASESGLLPGQRRPRLRRPRLRLRLPPGQRRPRLRLRMLTLLRVRLRLLI